MLTYSLSFRARCVPPLKKIISAQIVESLWNATFEPEDLAPYEERYWGDPLTSHRVKTISATKTLVEKNNLPAIFKTVFEESVFSLYQAYSQMILWKVNYDLSNEIKLLGENMLYAPNYFTVDGEFDDVAWAKSVVLDRNHPITCRFNLACLYWFEDETAMLWSKMKESHSLPFDGNLHDILHEMNNSLITLRIFQLENELEALSEHLEYAGNFYEVGFEESAREGYEHAAYYFWQNIAEKEKINIAGKDSFFHLVSAVDEYYPYNKICNFLYLQMSKERKEKFLDWSVMHERQHGWINLLLSPNTEEIRSEIVEFVYQLPDDLYSFILGFIASKIMNEKLPFDCEVFESLWTNLSPEEKDMFLEKTPPITDMLIDAQDDDSGFNKLDNVLKSLTLEQFDKYFNVGTWIIF